MFTFLGVVVVTLAFATLTAVLWAEGARRSKNLLRNRADRESERGIDMAKKLTAAEKQHKKDCDQIEDLEQQLADQQKITSAESQRADQMTGRVRELMVDIGHLEETNRSLKDGQAEREKDIFELAEHAGHLKTLADSLVRRFGSKRITN